MVDIWLIVMLCIPFAEVIFHTAMHYMKIKVRKIHAINGVLKSKKRRQKLAARTGPWSKGTKNHQPQAHSGTEKTGYTHLYQRGIEIIESVTYFGLPIFFILFSIFYFFSGLFLRYF